jgi:Holliday junction resolvase
VHIDSLLERLKEERVRRVIEPLMLGETVDVSTDDFQYTSDLGLIRKTQEGKIIPSNPIYAEVIVRTLSYRSQEDLRQSDSTYQMPRYFKNGQIDMDFLMADFQQFWRENSAIWVERFQYKEAAPHLILMAFLQRIINGGGDIIREPAAGTGRLDLCVIYKGKKYPIELKIRYDNKTLEKGLVQLAEYMDTFGEKHGWLCLFDRDLNKSWDEKIHTDKHETEDGKTITVVGL